MISTASQPSGAARRVLGLHAAFVLAALAVGLAAARLATQSQIGFAVLTTILGAAVLLPVSLWVLRRSLLQTEMLERLLAGFSQGLPDPHELPQLMMGSPAAAGWNRVVHQAREWFALDDLRESLSRGLSDAAGQASQGVLDALPEGVAATDEAGRLSAANPTFASIFHQDSPDALLKLPLVEVCALPAEVLAELSSAPAAARAAVEFSQEGGRIIRLIRSPRRGEGGVLLGHVWLARDVSQQRLAEEMRDKFLTTATHELRTPLANLCAYAESLAMLDDLDVQSQKQFYNIIQSESLRLSQLIDDLLDVSRMQAGALAIERRETDLARLVEEVAQKVDASMQAKDIEFVQELPPKYPKLSADKSKLAAALVNLLGNAAKYTPEGGRVTFRVNTSTDKVEFAVADTGIGIAPEELSRVFERFFRSHDDRIREIPGSGLGLSLTQEVARLHGGDLTVESELNVGSIFKLTLPIDAKE